MAEVVEAIRDPETWERITAQARIEVAENPRYSFKAMVETMDDGLELTTDRRPDRCRPGLRTASPLGASPASRQPGCTPAAFHRRSIASGACPRGSPLDSSPHPTAILPVSPGTEGRRRLRRHIRVARAFTYWSVRPRALPARGAGDRAKKPARGAERAERHPGSRPGGRIRAGPAARSSWSSTGRPESCASSPGPPDGVVATLISLPTDLTWVTALVIDLADPWLVPAGVRPERDRRLRSAIRRAPDRPTLDGGCSPGWRRGARWWSLAIPSRRRLRNGQPVSMSPD